MAYNIEIPGVTWETPLKGHMDVTLDDGRVVTKDYIRFAVPKGSSKEDPGYAEVCISDLPDHVFTEAILKGVSGLAMRGGYAKIKGPKTEDSRKNAMAAVQANLDALYAGNIRVSAGAKTKISGAVRTLAMQYARQLVKDAIKRGGEKISHYSAREITSAAEMILGGDHGKNLIAKARKEIEEREKEEPAIDISILQKDAAKVAKDEANKAKKAAERNKPKQSISQLAGVQATRRQQPEQRAR